MSNLPSTVFSNYGSIAPTTRQRLWTIGAALGTLVVLGARVIFVPPLHAQPQQICDSSGAVVPAAETTRSVELANFGIQVTIPSNYRTMLFQDGRVEILHPDDFQFLQCLAQGGAGGRGYYSETIRWVDPEPNQTLREQARWSLGGDREPYATEIMAYEADGISGYVSWTPGGYAVTFLGTVPGFDRILEVSANCDCEVAVEDVTSLLDRIEVLAEN